MNKEDNPPSPQHLSQILDRLIHVGGYGLAVLSVLQLAVFLDVAVDQTLAAVTGSAEPPDVGRQRKYQLLRRYGYGDVCDDVAAVFARRNELAHAVMAGADPVAGDQYSLVGYYQRKRSELSVDLDELLAVTEAGERALARLTASRAAHIDEV